jgi:transposase
MDEAWLRAELAKGRSIEAVAAERGCHPSTVAYWANKYGLTSQHAAKYAPRGGIEFDDLRSMVERGMSVRAIARDRGVSATSVRHWLRKHGLKTQPARYGSRSDTQQTAIVRECSLHGWVRFRRIGSSGRYRCSLCARELVASRRRAVKQILVDEAGGCCAICGYARYAGAMHFHHVDPATKAFGLSLGGLTRAIDVLRKEAEKCVLLCANCHAEVEAGIASVSPSSSG